MKAIKGRFRIKYNIDIVVKDKDGNVKQVFQPNALFLWLQKHNILNPHSWKVPVLFGKWDSHLNITNTVTSAGLAAVASRVNGSGGEAAFTYVAVGTGTNAASVNDTTLQTELAASGLSRAAATASRVTTDVTNDTAQLAITYTVTGSQAVTESGVLNAASTGTLLARQVFSAINVVNTDSLTLTWKFDID